MENSSIQKKAVEAMVAVNAAITNIRLYPPGSAIIANSLQKAYDHIQIILQIEDSIILAESEKNLIISGQMLGEKDQKKSQVKAIVELLLGFGIRSISFEKGVEEDELLTFLQILSRKPEEIEGGLQKTITDKNMPHIHLDHKFYVAMDKDHRIVAVEDAMDQDPDIQPLTEETATDSPGTKSKTEEVGYQAAEKHIYPEGDIDYQEIVKQRKKTILHLKSGLNSLMRGNNLVFEDQQLLQSLPGTVKQLFIKQKDKAAFGIIHRLREGLVIDNPAIRAGVSNSLFKIAKILQKEIQPDGNNFEKEAAEILELIKEDFPRTIPDTEAEADNLDGAFQKTKPVKTKSAMEDLAEQLKQVDQKVAQNEIEFAVKLLFELIVKYAKNKDFSKAELLREKLYKVDPMALNQIVESGEIIEAEKSDFIDQNHIKTWKKLYSRLTSEETNTLFYSLKEATYGPDKTLIRQGDINNNLYLINRGQLKIFYRTKDREIFLKPLGPGDTAGEDTFFSSTVCTTSLTTLSDVKLNYLTKDILAKWDVDFSSLASKLRNFCLELEKVSDLLKKKGEDRRLQNRINISGAVLIQLIDNSGSTIGKTIKGNLSDISAGGLSFFIKTAREKVARMLLGRKLNIKFILVLGQGRYEIEKNASVLAVHYHLSNDYSIHLKFEGLLHERISKEIDIQFKAENQRSL